MPLSHVWRDATKGSTRGRGPGRAASGGPRSAMSSWPAPDLCTLGYPSSRVQACPRGARAVLRATPDTSPLALNSVSPILRQQRVPATVRDLSDPGKGNTVAEIDVAGTSDDPAPSRLPFQAPYPIEFMRESLRSSPDTTGHPHDPPGHSN